ncbi:family 20 glycosylhydrolase [Actinomadura nitritigenes]|uniref:family 20 glycosylhydrolase n=1 Tax=Actinomadura nitritigenes TaxID=134602 RepID=UPI003D904FDB
MRLIPTPAAFQPRPGRFPLTPGTRVVVTDPRLTTAERLFRRRLGSWTGMRTAAEDGAATATVVLELGAVPELGTLPAPRGIRPALHDARDEQFRLTIEPRTVTVRAPSPEGVHRALTTLAQLAATTGDPAGLPCGTFLDGPRFAWRGLSLDLARCFLPVDGVERVIDLLDLYKLNTLHLHLTDDRAWRIQLPSRPALTTGGDFYTQADYARILAYAADRHITIVPEVDMPGHSAAAIAAYPELALSTAGDLARNTLDPASPATWRFVEDVIGDIARITPGRFLHIGADETFGMTADDHAAFVRRAAAIVARTGKHLAGWQEIARGDIPAGTVVQHWIETDRLHALTGELGELFPGIPAEKLVRLYAAAEGDLARALTQDAWILASPVSATYLDRRYAEPTADPRQETAARRLGHPLYPPGAIRESLDWDPDTLTDPGRITGIEAAVWGETLAGEADLHLLLLPRLAVIAERAWALTSPPWDTLGPHLAHHAPIWRRLGFTWYAAAGIPWQDLPGLLGAGAAPV